MYRTHPLLHQFSGGGNIAVLDAANQVHEHELDEMNQSLAEQIRANIFAGKGQSLASIQMLWRTIFLCIAGLSEAASLSCAQSL
jgi:hypothetical protein